MACKFMLHLQMPLLGSVAHYCVHLFTDHVISITV